MKNQINKLKTPIVFILVLVLLYSCKQDTNAEIQEFQKKITEYENQIKDLKDALNYDKAEKPSNIISSDQATKMYNLYSRRVRTINKEVGKDKKGKQFNATRSLFYDLGELENYIAYIKKQSKTAKVTPSGIRIYFAVYPDDHVRDKNNTDYANRQTLFFSPTVEQVVDGNTIHLGYTLSNDHSIMLLRDYLNGSSKIGGLSSNSQHIQTAGFFNSKTLFFEDNSLLSNELNTSPPRGTE